MRGENQKVTFSSPLLGFYFHWLFIRGDTYSRPCTSRGTFVEFLNLMFVYCRFRFSE